MAGIKPSTKAVQEESEDFELWEENLESYNWFARLSRRWVFNQFDGSRLRFDDVAIQAQFEIGGLKKSKRKNIMDDLLAMESAALEILNAKGANRG